MKHAEREAVFRDWLNRHKGLMVKVAASYARRPQDRDDLLQEILLQVWESIPSFQSRSKQSTWIYKVALYTAMSYKRKDRNRRLPEEDLDESLAETDNSQGSDSALNQLYEAIHQLGKVERSLALMHLEGLSYREIAQVLGITENHVGVKLTRIRKRLAQLLKA